MRDANFFWVLMASWLVTLVIGHSIKTFPHRFSLLGTGLVSLGAAAYVTPEPYRWDGSCTGAHVLVVGLLVTFAVFAGAAAIVNAIEKRNTAVAHVPVADPSADLAATATSSSSLAS